MDECDILARYLVGKPATPDLRACYQRALQNLPVFFNDKELKLWQTCLKNPWIIPHVDAYLGFSRATHPIRKKIFIMLGLLETQADYSDFFLSSRSSVFMPVAIVLRGTWAIIKIFTGRIVTWII
jgi:hypothetical protein